MANELSVHRNLDGRNSNITYDIEEVLGKKAKDFTEYAKETAEAGVWSIDKHAL